MKITKKMGAVALLMVILAASAMAAFADDAPSPWAQEQVKAAIEINLAPQNLCSNYTQAITRAEFCALAVSLYENIKGEITGRVSFADTNDKNVEKMAYAGIVSGVGGNRFDPNGTLTREQAAVMLSRLSDALDQPFPKQAAAFADNSSIAAWAVESVGRVQAAAIMNGVDGNKFAPQQPYTREQSIITILRTHDIIKSEEPINMGSQPISNATVQYIRTNGYIDGVNYPQITVISTKNELEQYYEKYKDKYDFFSRESAYTDSATGFVDAMKKYTDDFFADHYLAIILLEEGSGSIRHRVERIEENGGIVISRLSPEIGTSDMAEWHIIIELDNSFKPEQFSAVFIDTLL